MKTLKEARESYLWALQRIRQDQQSSLVINRIEKYVQALEHRLPGHISASNTGLQGARVWIDKNDDVVIEVKNQSDIRIPIEEYRLIHYIGQRYCMYNGVRNGRKNYRVYQHSKLLRANWSDRFLQVIIQLEEENQCSKP